MPKGRYRFRREIRELRLASLQLEKAYKKLSLDSKHKQQTESKQLDMKKVIAVLGLAILAGQLAVAQTNWDGYGADLTFCSQSQAELSYISVDVEWRQNDWWPMNVGPVVEHYEYADDNVTVLSHYYSRTCALSGMGISMTHKLIRIKWDLGTAYWSSFTHVNFHAVRMPPNIPRVATGCEYHCSNSFPNLIGPTHRRAYGVLIFEATGGDYNSLQLSVPIWSWFKVQYRDPVSGTTWDDAIYKQMLEAGQGLQQVLEKNKFCNFTMFGVNTNGYTLQVDPICDETGNTDFQCVDGKIYNAYVVPALAGEEWSFYWTCDSAVVGGTTKMQAFNTLNGVTCSSPAQTVIPTTTNGLSCSFNYTTSGKLVILNSSLTVTEAPHDEL